MKFKMKMYISYLSQGKEDMLYLIWIQCESCTFTIFSLCHFQRWTNIIIYNQFSTLPYILDLDKEHILDYTGNENSCVGT